MLDSSSSSARTVSATNSCKAVGARPAVSRSITFAYFAFFALAMTCFNTVLPIEIAQASELTHTFRAEIQPLLKQLCFDCHSASNNKSGVRLDQLDPDVVHGDSAELWHDAMDQVNLGEMPPKTAKQPTIDQRQKLTRWIQQALRESLAAKRFRNGRVATRRLTRYEYANTMRDLLSLDMDFAKDLPPEPASPEGFLNNGGTLEMSPTQIEIYLKAAREALAEAIVIGDAPKVYQYSQTQTATGRFPTRKFAGHEPVKPEFVLDVNEFPRHGEFELKITAHAAVPTGDGLPRMLVSMGHVPGIIHVPRGEIGEADVSEREQVFTFRGRMEDFPQPGPIAFGNSGFKGLIVMVDFVTADGEELRYADRQYPQVKPPPKKKTKNTKPMPAKLLPPLEEAAQESFGNRLDVRITKMEFRAPVVASWPPPSHQRLLIPSESSNNEPQYAREVLEPFMTRAYRRPVTEQEVEQTAQLFERVRAQSPTFEHAIRETFAAVLVSPHFLYIVERRQASKEQQVSPYELASRLSYFLWSTMPDPQLFELARQGKLSDTSVLREQTLRMLADPRASEFTKRFVDQWLDLEALERVAVNPEFFPEFDNRLKDEMRKETHAYFAEILQRDRSALELLDSDWAMWNRPLAKHYGLSGSAHPRSWRLEKVALPNGQRGGLLGQGAFLLANSNGEDSHPIKRAVWILDRLLDDPPLPPPPDVPELDPDSPDLAQLTLKQKLAAHREKESCASCHRGIDPWGVPLENYDAVGRWRTMVPAHKKRPASVVDAVSELPHGAKIDGPYQLRQHLVGQQHKAFARSIVKRIMAYGLGRSLDFGDRAAIKDLTAQFADKGHRLQPLIIDFVQSETFLLK